MVYLFISALAGLFLGYVLKPKTKTIQKFYPVDSSGIEVNPPKNFIDIWAGKTLNLKIKDLEVTIPPMPINQALSNIRLLQSCYASLEEISKSDDTPLDNKQIKERQGIIINLYHGIIGIIYLLSRDSVHGWRARWKYSRKLMKAGMDNHEIVLSITNEILKYWSFLGLKKKALAVGKCFEEIHGGGYTWNSSGTGDQQKILITPLYELPLNTPTKKTNEPMKK